MKKEISFHNKFLTLRLEWIIGKYRFVPSAMLPFSPNHTFNAKRGEPKFASKNVLLLSKTRKFPKIRK